MAPPSIVRRLVLALTGGMALLWLLAAGLAALSMRHELAEASDSALQEVAQRLLPLAVDDLFDREEDEDRPRRLAASTVTDHDEYLTYQLRDAGGRVLLRSHDAPAEPYDAPLRHGFADSSGWRVYTEPAISGTLFMQVAEPLRHRREALVESAATLLLPLLVLLPLSALGIWWAVRRFMRPVLRLREEIGRRDGSHLEPVGGQGMPAEILPIAEALDRLLARLRDALEAERAFTANSAHELRTPIASALAQTQRLRAAAADPDLRARAQGIEAALLRLSALAEKLLQLSRAEAGIAAVRSPQDLMPALRLVLAEFPQVRLLDAGQSALPARLDIDAFAIVLRNLVENAVRHGGGGEPATVALAPDGTLHVANGGPAVPADQLGSLTRRFVRGSSRAGGSGLGLAIADTILRQAGGQLVLHSPALGKQAGFEAVVVLPR